MRSMPSTACDRRAAGFFAAGFFLVADFLVADFLAAGFFAAGFAADFFFVGAIYTLVVVARERPCRSNRSVS